MNLFSFNSGLRNDRLMCFFAADFDYNLIFFKFFS